MLQDILIQTVLLPITHTENVKIFINSLIFRITGIQLWFLFVISIGVLLLVFWKILWHPNGKLRFHKRIWSHLSKLIKRVSPKPFQKIDNYTKKTIEEAKKEMLILIPWDTIISRIKMLLKTIWPYIKYLVIWLLFFLSSALLVQLMYWMFEGVSFGECSELTHHGSKILQSMGRIWSYENIINLKDTIKLLLGLLGTNILISFIISSLFYSFSFGRKPMLRIARVFAVIWLIIFIIGVWMQLLVSNVC